MSERDNDTGPGRGNRPIETLRDGALKVSIFRNSGDRGDFYSMVPGRIFTDDKSDKIRETSSLSGSEPLRMANLLTKGYERVADFRAQSKEDRESTREEQGTEDRTQERGQGRGRGKGRERSS
jgi:hypothetical protein